MEIEDSAPKNATLVSNVPIITGEIKNNIQKGTYILAGNTTVPAETTVNIAPETVFYANRDAKIVVHGKLAANNVTWQSNQVYSQRRYWYGLTAENGGEINLSDVRITDATAGITITAQSRTKIDNADFSNNVVGVVTFPDSTVKITNTTIANGTVGLQILGGSPQIDKITLKSLFDGMRITPSATPRTTNISYNFIAHEEIHRLPEATAK
jgi:hypothetical protein